MIKSERMATIVSRSSEKKGVTGKVPFLESRWQNVCIFWEELIICIFLYHYHFYMSLFISLYFIYLFIVDYFVFIYLSK